VNELLRASWSRSRTELLQFRRSREDLFFTIAFPVLMLVLFGTIFHNSIIGPPRANVSFSQYFAAGMIGSAIWWTGFQNLAIGIARERDSGALKRLAISPIPKSAYFIGKTVLVVVVAAVECALLTVVGASLFRLHTPSTADWLNFSWLFALGVASCMLFGLATAGVIRGAWGSTAVTPFAIIMQFLSGVYFVYGDLPGWLQSIGQLFPLKWLTQGMRSVYLPDRFHLAEPGGAWNHGSAALVLLAWCVGGLAVTLLTFRWTPARER
jgi:ABC-2 type transport system permease protein